MTGSSKFSKTFVLLIVGSVLLVIAVIQYVEIDKILDYLRPISSATKEKWSELTSMPFGMWTMETIGSLINNSVVTVLIIVAAYGWLLFGGAAILCLSEAVANYRNLRD